MDALHARLASFAVDAEERGIAVVTIGGLAMRAYLQAPDWRATGDLDLVVGKAQYDQLRALLEERGFTVYDAGPWKRAELQTGEHKRIIDVFVDAVVDLASFASYAIDARDAQRRGEPGGPSLLVPRIEHLIALKLLAHRDKDVLDVVLLLCDRAIAVDRAEFERALEIRDVEVPVRRGYLSVLAAIESGEMQRLWEARVPAPFDQGAVDHAVARLHTLFR